MMIDSAQVSRLRWRCRRGTQELDILLTRGLDQITNNSSNDEIARFEKLLACEDSELQRWFLAYETCHDPELSRLVETIRAVPCS